MIPLRSESDDRSLPARTPIASYVLALLVVASSLFVQAGVDDLLLRYGRMLALGVTPDLIDSGAVPLARPDGLLGHLLLQRGEHFRPSQLVGVAFVHMDAWHLFGNVLLLLIVGGPLCRAVGNLRFVVLWLGAAVTCSIAALALSDTPLCMGASGVAMGLTAACALAAPTTRVWVLTHPLPFLLGLAGLLGLITLGDLACLLASFLFMIGWAVRALLTWGDGADMPEGLVARLFGFVLLRPCVPWLAGGLVALDVVGMIAGDGEGLVATILRAIAGGSCHAGHLGGAVGGALLAWTLGAGLAASATAPASAREQAQAAWTWAKRLARRARATWDALEAGEWPRPEAAPAATGALRRTRSPAMERHRRRAA
jgi:membrane associated rhomboid family serine protease